MRYELLSTKIESGYPFGSRGELIGVRPVEWNLVAGLIADVCYDPQPSKTTEWRLVACLEGDKSYEPLPSRAAIWRLVACLELDVSNGTHSSRPEEWRLVADFVVHARYEQTKRMDIGCNFGNRIEL